MTFNLCKNNPNLRTIKNIGKKQITFEDEHLKMNLNFKYIMRYLFHNQRIRSTST